MLARLWRIGAACGPSPLRVALSRSAGSASGPSPSPPDPDPRLIRFRDDSGQEAWGRFADILETHAHVAELDAAGRWSLPPRGGGGAPPLRIETLLPPLDPLAIFCIGLNYRAHAAEVGMPLPATPIVFSKTVNALTGHGGAILLPRIARDEVDYEVRGR